MASPKTSLRLDYVLVALHRAQLESLVGETVPVPLVSNQISDSQQATTTSQHQAVPVQISEQDACIKLRSSQLFMLKGDSMTALSPSDLPSLETLNARPARKAVKIACVSCRSAAKRCDSCRPCARCIKRGLEESCVDAPTKRGNSIREESAAAAQALEQPLWQMPTSTSMEKHEASHLDPVEGGSTGWIAPEAVYTNHQLPNSSARFPPYETGNMGQIAHTHNATAHGLAQAVAPVMPPIVGYPNMQWTSPGYVPSGAGQAYIEGDLPGDTQSEALQPYPGSSDPRAGAPFS